MEWKKNDVFQVIIEDMSESGEGIGKTEGFAWFIKDTVIGDEIEAKVMKVKKSYGFARLIKLLTPSPGRIEPRCLSARPCGGCQFQAMNYEEQLKFKAGKIQNHLKRIGGFLDLPPISVEGMEDPWRYRNKSQFPWGINNEGELVYGFYAGHSHTIVPHEDCFLGTEENKIILEKIKKHMEQHHIAPYDDSTHTGLMRHTLIRKGFHTGQIMVCQVINGSQLPCEEQLVESLMEIQGITSVSINSNREKTNVILGNHIRNLYGPGYIEDFIGEVKFRISPLSFFQVNPVQTQKLYRMVLEDAQLTGNETVWDLYCGIGTISLFLAQKAKRVYGVEIVSQAIEDARENAALNGIDSVEFFVGKAEEVLPEHFELHQVYADVIVVDPPRKGCDQVCLDTIIKMQPQRVVYVSCDSSTLARDLKYLGENGFELVRVRGCDMFPWTGHVECVVEIRRVEK